jgi:hypothetical protein
MATTNAHTTTATAIARTRDRPDMNPSTILSQAFSTMLT